MNLNLGRSIIISVLCSLALIGTASAASDDKGTVVPPAPAGRVPLGVTVVETELVATAWRASKLIGTKFIMSPAIRSGNRRSVRKHRREVDGGDCGGWRLSRGRQTPGCDTGAPIHPDCPKGDTSGSHKGGTQETASLRVRSGSRLADNESSSSNMQHTRELLPTLMERREPGDDRAGRNRCRCTRL
jgi:hypothetical protein